MSRRNVAGEYGDYRDGYPEHLDPSVKKKSASAALSVLDSNKDTDKPDTISSSSVSNSSKSEHIALPTRTPRPLKLLCCFTSSSSSSSTARGQRSRHRSGSRGEKATCQACDKWYYDDENMKGVCASQRTSCDRVVEVCTCTPALNCCLKRCTADSNGQYNPAWHDDTQRVPTTPERECRRRTVCTLLSCLLPCILCHEPCKACLERGKQKHYWGAKHIPDPKAGTKSSL